MKHDGLPLPVSRRHRCLLLLDLAAINLRDVLSQQEASFLTELRRRLRTGRKVPGTAIVDGLRLLGARAAGGGHSYLAASLYQGVVELTPDDFASWYNLGNHLTRLGDQDRALRAYDESLRLNSEHAWALFNRGCLHYDRAEYEAAVRDFLDAARLACDLDQFANTVVRRLVPLRGFVSVLELVSDPSLPGRMRGRLTMALRAAIDEARELDGWFLSRWPGAAGDDDFSATLVLHAVLADVLRESPGWLGLFFGRTDEGYDVREIDESDLRESLWYLPLGVQPAPPDRSAQLTTLREAIMWSRNHEGSEATCALHYASGAIALSLLMDGAEDWPTPVLRLAVEGRTVGRVRRADQEAVRALEEWISIHDGVSVADFALGHFRSAADHLTTLIRSHREPDRHVTLLMGDDGPLLTDQGELVTRPVCLDLAKALWWYAEAIYREWVLAAAHAGRAGERLAALCHARRFNALAATELWSQLEAEHWQQCRVQVAALYDAHVSQADIQAALGEETTLVDFYTYEVVGESLSRLTLTGCDATAVTHEIDVVGGELRELFHAGSPSRLPATGLSHAIGEHLLPAPERITQNLLITPYGYLRKIPIHSLPQVRQAVDSGTLKRIVYMATSSLAGRPQHSATRPCRILFVGHDPSGDIDCAYDLEALRAYGSDITVLLGEHATCGRVRAELPRHDLVHFACHGDMDENLAAGYLILADGRLYPWDVLEDAVPETVVLNSCLGVFSERIEATSDAAVGLHDAFLAAGARHVVGSLWELPESTAQLFADLFYRRLAAGEDAPQAVTSAQRELRSYTQDPFFWAPHACFGVWPA